MIRLRHVVASPVDKGNIGLHEYIALEHIEAVTGRLLPGIQIEKKEDPQAVRYEPNDVLFGKLRPYLHKVYQPDREGLCSAELLVLRPRTDQLTPRYLYYVVLSKAFKDWATATSYGVKMPRTSWELLRSYPIPDRSSSQQRLIADFLDRETHRINALVDAKRRMLKQLREKRIAEIQLAMTSGISGELEEIAQRPLRSAAEVQIGRQRSPRHAEGPFMTRYLRAANIKDRQLELGDVKEMNFTPSEQRVFRLEPGDVLVTEGAGSLEAIGAAAVWDAELPGTVCYQNTLIRLRPRPGISARYLGWWASWAYNLGHFASVASGANIFHLSSERVRTLAIKTPQLHVQEELVRQLEHRVNSVAAAIESLNRQLDLLAEYRQALITQAVTGQLDEATLKGDRAVDEAVGVIPE